MVGEGKKPLPDMEPGEGARKKSVKQISTDEFRQYASGTTLHGINHFIAVETSWLRRGIWVISFLCFLGWFSSYFIDRALYLTSSPTTTKITRHPQENIQFPSVTMCNYNYLRKSVATSNADFRSIGEFLSGINLHGLVPFDSLSPGALGVNVSALYRAGAHTLEDTLSECRFKNKVLAEDYTAYFTRVLTRKGLCYTFNSHAMMKERGLLFNVSKTGVEYGLMMRLDVSQDEYFVSTSLSAGFMVHVHHPKALPNPHELGFGVMPGTETMVALHEVHVGTLLHWNSELLGQKQTDEGACVDTEAADFVNPLHYFDHYSYHACRQECVVKEIIRECACAPYYSEGASERHCNANETFVCVVPLETILYDEVDYEATCGCKRPCYEISYTKSLSFASFPSNQMKEVLSNVFNVTPQYMRENFVELRLYFEELSYEKVEEIPSYTSSDFQGDVGGQLGLCLGASMLTLLELLEFLYTLLKRLIRRCQNVGQAPN